MATPPEASDVRDILLPLAQSLHATPSSHVLLLGAGSSVAAGVESAWGVLTELIHGIARQRGETFDDVGDADIGEAAVAWYEDTFNTTATYESVLAQLGLTPTERQRLLRGFFEADEDDRANGLKRPTAAHHAIASLVKSGHVRIIVTLNFDTLIEQAIREIGIEPTVVSGPTEIAGMAPLHIHDALILHLHGQYLAPASMRNTVDELASYEPVEDAVLDQLFTNYGVVAVGWSAKYDRALRAALARTRCAHFSSYWIEPGNLAPIADQLRAARGMNLVVATADIALGTLSDAVQALADTTTRHPQSASVAVATAKRQLSGARVAIGVHDMLNAEFSRIRTLPGLDAAAIGRLPDSEYPSLLRRLESECELPTALVATTAFWGDNTTDQWLVSEIERSARPLITGGTIKVLRLPHLPAFLWSTAASVAAAAAGRWQLVRRLLVDTTVGFPGDEPAPAAVGLTVSALYLDRPSWYPFDLLAPLFVKHLGLTQSAWIDAWESIEILRMAIRLIASRGPEFLAAAADAARAGELDPEPAVAARRKTLDLLANRVRVHAAHIRVRDARFDDLYWPITGVRLVEDLRRAGASHPLVAAGVLSEDASASVLALDAVNLAVARKGNDAAWRHANGATMSSIPSYIWLDTGEIPERDN